MVYIKLRSFNLPATVTNKRNHVAKGFVDDLVKKNMKEGKLVSLEFVSKISHRCKKIRGETCFFRTCFEN